MAHVYAVGPSSSFRTPVEHLLDLIRPPAWHAYAACRGRGAVMFPHSTAEAAQAVLTCRGCMVRAECAQAGRDEPAGVWGGEVHEQPEPKPQRRAKRYGPKRPGSLGLSDAQRARLAAVLG